MFMLLLTVAGNETTRNTTSWGMWALMENPEQYKALRATSPASSTRRDRGDPALGDAGVPLPPHRTRRHRGRAARRSRPGDKVVMWHTSADRDEAVFEDPFRFDIERWPNKHIAFGGGGAHYCLGANLARMELHLIFQRDPRADPRHAAGRRGLDAALELHRRRKHMPVTFPGAKKNPGPVELKGTLVYDKWS